MVSNNAGFGLSLETLGSRSSWYRLAALLRSSQGRCSQPMYRTGRQHTDLHAVTSADDPFCSCCWQGTAVPMCLDTLPTCLLHRLGRCSWVSFSSHSCKEKVNPSSQLNIQYEDSISLWSEATCLQETLQLSLSAPTASGQFIL